MTVDQLIGTGAIPASFPVSFSGQRLNIDTAKWAGPGANGEPKVLGDIVWTYRLLTSDTVSVQLPPSSGGPDYTHAIAQATESTLLASFAVVAAAVPIGTLVTALVALGVALEKAAEIVVGIVTDKEAEDQAKYLLDYKYVYDSMLKLCDDRGKWLPPDMESRRFRLIGRGLKGFARLQDTDVLDNLRGRERYQLPFLHACRYRRAIDLPVRSTDPKAPYYLSDAMYSRLRRSGDWADRPQDTAPEFYYDVPTTDEAADVWSAVSAQGGLTTVQQQAVAPFTPLENMGKPAWQVGDPSSIYGFTDDQVVQGRIAGQDERKAIGRNYLQWASAGGFWAASGDLVSNRVGFIHWANIVDELDPHTRASVPLGADYKDGGNLLDNQNNVIAWFKRLGPYDFFSLVTPYQPYGEYMKDGNFVPAAALIKVANVQGPRDVNTLAQLIVTGKAGPDDLAAFQRAAGLPVTSKADDATRAALVQMGALPSPSAAPPVFIMNTFNPAQLLSHGAAQQVGAFTNFVPTAAQLRDPNIDAALGFARVALGRVQVSDAEKQRTLATIKQIQAAAQNGDPNASDLIALIMKAMHGPPGDLENG